MTDVKNVDDGVPLVDGVDDPVNAGLLSKEELAMTSAFRNGRAAVRIAFEDLNRSCEFVKPRKCRVGRISSK
jgi:hypothetical protein